ncbi:hypothetical protein MRB53_011997 [Persea americana]|uniref:Uncharacterized protein n=1 Tax=Persea americana TaxID=3435 RepID=A0ACC2LWG2_PERAE|nr:hypothetical protein MRB53_011997 [Persea americana]
MAKLEQGSSPFFSLLICVDRLAMHCRIHCRHPATISSPCTSHAYYSDVCVGTIACCLEKKEGGTVCVYIMTLGVLAPYRGLGIGMHITTLSLRCKNQKPCATGLSLKIFRASVLH